MAANSPKVTFDHHGLAVIIGSEVIFHLVNAQMLRAEQIGERVLNTLGAG